MGLLDQRLELLSKEFKVPIKSLNVRADGRVEWVCEHGIGHTIYSPRDSDSDYIHGCDGCCSELSKK